MSDNGVLAALRRMGFPKDEMTGHGFQAMARQFVADCLVNDALGPNVGAGDVGCGTRR